MNNKHTKPFGRIVLTLVALAYFVYVAFFTEGYYSGGAKALLSAVVLGTALAFVGSYNKARKSEGRGHATRTGIKWAVGMWFGVSQKSKSAPKMDRKDSK